MYQDSSVRTWPLVPSQHWFFHYKFEHPHRWNVARMFASQRPLSAELLRCAVAAVLFNHEALRAQFTPRDGRWCQHAEAEIEDYFRSYDLRRLPATDQDGCIRDIAELLDGGFVFGRGPLVRFALIDLGRARGCRLLIVAHHLVCDGMSIQVLIEDIDAAYRWLQTADAGVSREDVPLERTTSLADWALHLHDDQARADAIAEAQIWAARAVRPIPVDFAAEQAIGWEQVTLRFEKRRTERLVYAAHRRHHVSLDTLLLAAAAHVISTWSDAECLVINLVFHGRQNLHSDIDLTRTVGFLAWNAPLSLHLPSRRRAEDAVTSVVDALRRFPRDGLGYGVLRFIVNGNSQHDLPVQSEPDVAFNYLGDSDSPSRRLRLFTAAHEPLGIQYFKGNRSPRPLSISCLVAQQALTVRFRYSERLHRRSTIETVAGLYDQAVTDIAGVQ